MIEPSARPWLGRRLKRALLALAALPILYLGVGAALPRTWQIEEGIEVAATPEALHAIVDDLANFDDWYNHARDRDERQRVQLSQQTRGVGATIRWNGLLMGNGSLTITKSEPNAGVWFDEAIEADTPNASGSITFEATDRGTTNVTWRDEGTIPAIYGGYYLPGIQDALSDHFRMGLERLKQRAEQPPRVAPPPR